MNLLFEEDVEIEVTLPWFQICKLAVTALVLNTDLNTLVNIAIKEKLERTELKQ